MDGSLDKATKRMTFEHQPDGHLAQANPAVDQWYTVLDAQNKEAKVYSLTVLVWTTNETLEVKVTIDGNVLTGSIEATHTTYYYVHHALYAEGLVIDGNVFLLGKYAPLEGRNVKIEVRKTTEAGSGTLEGRAVWAKR
jgi:hypothetical protein